MIFVVLDASLNFRLSPLTRVQTAVLFIYLKVIVTAFNETRSTMESYLPIDKDIRGANLALIRLQKTYNIPMEELLNGIVAGRQTQALSQREVLEIALTAINSSLSEDAIIWLTAGMYHRKPPLVIHRQDLYHALARAYALVRLTYSSANLLYTFIGSFFSCISFIKLVK